MTSAAAGGTRSARLVVAVVAPARWRAPGRGLASWLVRAAPAGARGGVSVALIGDAAMRRLNRHFRGVDAPTDVLSFPSGDARLSVGTHHAGRRRRHMRRGSSRNGNDINHLGDIAIAVGVASRQAVRYGHGLSTEIRVLALHGLLHLLGYDHDRDQGQMLRLEARLRRRMNLPAGLLARAAGPDARR